MATAENAITIAAAERAIVRIAERRDAGAAPTAGAASGSAPSPSRAILASPMSRSRFLESRSRQRFSSLTMLGGVAGGSSFHSIGARRTDASVSETVSPSNARFPVNISKRHAPNDQMSARRSTFVPRACSGAM